MKSASATGTATNSIASTKTILKQHGLRLTGETPDGIYVEICELAGHPWYLGCQFHPEFKSKPLEPHPLFQAFIGAALEHHKRRAEGVREPAVAPAPELRREASVVRS